LCYTADHGYPSARDNEFADLTRYEVATIEDLYRTAFRRETFNGYRNVRGNDRRQNIPDGQFLDTEEWVDGKGTILIAWGILNPNGPTLYCLGYREVNGKQRIFFRWLHMLGGCTTYARTPMLDDVSYQRIFDDAIEINDHLVKHAENGIMMIVPSFLVANNSDPVLIDIAKRLLTITPVAKADWGLHLSYQRVFGSDFFGRAACDTIILRD
jgi:hypothetical protein